MKINRNRIFFTRANRALKHSNIPSLSKTPIGIFNIMKIKNNVNVNECKCIRIIVYHGDERAIELKSDLLRRKK